MAYQIEKALEYTNIAEVLDEETLQEVGQSLKDLVEDDDESRSQWLEDQEEWLKLGSQVVEEKSFPWQGACNVKYPLLTLATMQFHARSMSALVDPNQPVRVKVNGRDPDGRKLKIANRVSKWMSYQVLEQMPEWLDDMDRLLFVLPIIGICFKKTYYSESCQRIKSSLILPKDLIINYHANSFERARMSHVMYMDRNEIKELQNREIFLDKEIGSIQDVEYSLRDDILGFTPSSQERETVEIVESHCWLDLDDDGYKEPYIVTFVRDTGEVLRIVARWDEDDVEVNAKGKIVKIEAEQYFTPFVFIPDPSSAVYGIGFGRLLGPTNHVVNTVINQLIDSGTLATLQSGFISRGINLKTGNWNFRPGEWKKVNTTGEDLAKGIFPLPTKEPSAVLFNLLGLLINAGQQVSSVSDIMMGENPGQNQPATTTMAVLEQGQKVFSSIHRRNIRSLTQEYNRIYELDRMYVNEDEYLNFLDEPTEVPPEVAAQIDPEQLAQVQQMLIDNAPSIMDFDEEGMNITPTADPTVVSDAQKLAKSQALLEKLAAGLPLNPQVVTRRMLEAEGQEDVDELMTLPPQPVNEKLELEKLKLQIEAYKAKYDSILKVAQAEAAEKGTQLDYYRGFIEDNLNIMGALNQEGEGSPGQGAGQTGAIQGE